MMTNRTKARRAAICAIGLAIPGLSACVDYTIETTLQADGSGVRSEKMEVGDNEDLKLSPREFTDLMLVTPDRGWTHTMEVGDKNDTTYVLERRIPLEDLASWSILNDAVQLRGALSRDRNASFGVVTLGDVRFRNRVEVQRGTRADGRTSLTYRETFYWDGAVEALVEAFMEPLSQALTDKYPLLSEAEQGEVVGIARAHLWAACEDGMLSDDANEDRLLDQARDRTVEQVVPILRSRYPQEGESNFRDLLQHLYDGDGEVGEKAVTLFEERLPGLNLAFNTSLKIRLTMPGQVVSSNHQDKDGSTLVWELAPLDAAAQPFEIYAESVVDAR